MKLSGIERSVNYDLENLMEMNGKVNSVDLDNGEIVFTSDKIKYKMDITEYGLAQLLVRLDVKPYIAGIMKNFVEEDISQTTLTPRTYRTRNEILKDIVNLGLRHKQKFKFKFIYDSNIDVVRGVMGRSYARVPNADVLNSAVEVYGRSIDTRFSYAGKQGTMNLFFESDTERLAPISDQRILYAYNVGNSELGGKSLSINEALVFLVCLNGLILGKLVVNATRLTHTKKVDVMKSLFSKALIKHKENKEIPNIIDRWATKPAIYSNDLSSDNEVKKLDILLSKYGINKKEYREQIITILKDEKDDRPINSFRIGDATNYFGSNIIQKEDVAHELLISAFNLMVMQ